MSSRKKILVVAGNLSHLDQFVIHGFFKDLAQSSSVYLTMPEDDFVSERWAEVSQHVAGVFTEVLPYVYTKQSRSAGYQLGAALTYRFRKRSASYRVRILESYFGGFDLPLKIFSRAGFAVLTKNRRELLKRIVHEFPAMTRGMRVFFWAWSKLVTKKINKGCLIEKVLKEVQPDVTLTFMQRQAGFVIASIASGDKLNIPTILIPYKWDNASSKSPLICTPTRMLVYNRAIKEVCSDLHKMRPNAVVEVGSVEIGRGDVQDLKSGQVIVPLIGATIDTQSAAPWLRQISVFLSSKSEIAEIAKPKFIWRPYPTAEPKNLKFMSQFIAENPRISLDSDIANAKSHRSSKISFADAKSAYERYISLLRSSSFVVSEGTSVIVDARARGLAVIYPAFKKGAVVGSQWHRLNTSNHLIGLRETTGVFIAEDEEQLEMLLKDFLSNPRRIPPDNSGENIFVDHRTYAQRVLDVVDEVVAEKFSTTN